MIGNLENTRSVRAATATLRVVERNHVECLPKKKRRKHYALLSRLYLVDWLSSCNLARLEFL